jgi:large subunit ribosomal protein L10
MRPEKKYLVEEVGKHLDKSNYVFLADFTRINVEQTGELRDSLAKEQAEFHVIKNSILGVAAKVREYPDLSQWLNGQTAIIVGGKNPSGVAKILKDFFKKTEKVDVKVGVMDSQLLTASDVKVLADLPPIEVVKAQLLGLLNTPAQRLVSLFNAVPTQVVTLLKAKADKDAA